MTTEPCLPFLKWPGGKRWLAVDLAKMIRPFLSGVYYEPFLGGGATFFELMPRRAVLSDINTDLVNVYLQVRKNHESVLERLRGIRVEASVYNEIRARRSRNQLQRAVDFLYLNRTAWGGIYRLNSTGRFNVPYGGGKRTPESLWRNGLLSSAAKALEKAAIVACDFEVMLEKATKGDVVYCDPTYTVAHDNNGFIRYNESNFSWADQLRLAEACKRAAKRGAFVVVSNAHHPDVKQLYAHSEARTFSRKSLVSASPEKRGNVDEYVFIIK
jgi:DNA adenine methylase